MSESSLSGTDERKFFAVPKCRIQLRVWKLKKVARSSYPPPTQRSPIAITRLKLVPRSAFRSRNQILHAVLVPHLVNYASPQVSQRGCKSAVPTCLPPAVSFTPSGHYPAWEGRNCTTFWRHPRETPQRTALGNCDHLLKRQSPSPHSASRRHQTRLTRNCVMPPLPVMGSLFGL